VAVGTAPVRVARDSKLGQGGMGEKQWVEGMPGCPFKGLEGKRGCWVMEGNRRWQWCNMMVVEVTVSGGDRMGRWWGVKRGVLWQFREQMGGSVRACSRGGGGGRSARGGR
jgi:hypothetical protein